MKVYVGTYGKYNSGSIKGQWVNLDDYSDHDEFIEAMRQLHSDEDDPELMYQDVETEYSWEEAFYDESGIDPKYWELKDTVAGFDQEAFSEYLSEVVDTNDIMYAIEHFEEAYRGQYDSGADFMEQFFEETGGLENCPDNLRSYIDWESMFRDEELSGFITITHSGYVFDRT